jgi:hypothetical protein
MWKKLGGSGTLSDRKMACWRGVVSVRRSTVPLGPTKRPRCIFSSSQRRSRQVSTVAFSATRIRRRPSQQRTTWARMRFLFAVIHRTEVQPGLYVPPGPLHLEQLLVPQRNILGREGGIRGPQQVLAVEVRVGADLGLVDAQQPAGRDAEEAAGGMTAKLALDLGAFALWQPVGAVVGLLEMLQQQIPDGGVAHSLDRVATDDEPISHGATVDHHLFDLKVVPDAVVRPWLERAARTSLSFPRSFSPTM